MKILKSVYLLIIISIFILSISINSFAGGKDIWLIDGKEVEQLPDELLNNLQNDPYVREALGLEDIEVQRDNTDSIYSKFNLDSDNNISTSLTPNTVSHIKTIASTNISNVSITGKNVGIVIEKSLTDKFELDYVGVEDINNFSFKDTMEGKDTLKIEVSANSKVNYIDTTPNNKVNVINVKIPEKTYNNFYIDIDTGATYLPSITGKVDITSNKSSIKVVANQFESNLNLNIQKSSLKFNVAKVTNNIDIKGIDTGNSVKIAFSQQPKNLKLDATKCQGSINLPNKWNKSYEVGTSKPLINLNVKGSIKISVENNQEALYKITTETAIGGAVFGAGDYALNDTVNLKATPSAGYRFIGWQIDNIVVDDYKSSEISFIMPSEDIHVIAIFEKEAYKVTTEPTKGGTVFGAGDYTLNDTVNLKAIPSAGYRFIGWQIDNIVVDDYKSAEISFIMPSEDIHVIAIFEEYKEFVTLDYKDLAFNIITEANNSNNGTVSTKLNDNYNRYTRHIEIPETVIDAYGDIYTVTEINDTAFTGFSNLQSIKLPISINSIGNNAFEACKNLKDIDIPKSVNFIGNNAFKSCDNLRTVTIYSDNINIENNAFSKPNIKFNIANKNIESQILPFVTDEIQIHVLGEKPSLEKSIKSAKILIIVNCN